MYICCIEKQIKIKVMKGIKLQNNEIDGSVTYLNIYKELSKYLPENHSSTNCEVSKICSYNLTEDFYDGRNNTDFIKLSYDDNKSIKFYYSYGVDDNNLTEVNSVDEFIKESILLITENN